MNKRFVSLLIIISLAFTVFTVNANAVNKGMNSFFDKISDYSSEDRQNLFTIIYPMIIVDSGIDGLISIVNTHSEESEGMFAPYVAKLLSYTTKEDVEFVLNALKIIPEKTRNKYFTIIKNRTEADLSPAFSVAFSAFMKKVYEDSPNLNKMLAEDGITEKVIANFLGIIPAANNNVPVLKVDDKNRFSLNKIDSGISDKANMLTARYNKELDLTSAMNSFAKFINSTPLANRQDIVKVFVELGICKAYDDGSGSASDSTESSDTGVTSGVVGNPEVVKSVFTDIEGWYKPYITTLADKGIVSGRGDGKFYPNDTVTREEFVKMICNAVGLPPVDTATDFADIDNDSWYAPYINTAYYMGIIKGQSETMFGVGKNILRQDAALICNNIISTIISIDNTRAPFADDASIAEYAKAGVYSLASVGIINGDNLGNFNPTSNLTRGESAKIICELMNYMNKSK